MDEKPDCSIPQTDWRLNKPIITRINYMCSYTNSMSEFVAGMTWRWPEFGSAWAWSSPPADQRRKQRLKRWRSAWSRTCCRPGCDDSSLSVALGLMFTWRWQRLWQCGDLTGLTFLKWDPTEARPEGILVEWKRWQRGRVVIHYLD